MWFLPDVTPRRFTPFTQGVDSFTVNISGNGVSVLLPKGEKGAPGSGSKFWKAGDHGGFQRGPLGDGAGGSDERPIVQSREAGRARSSVRLDGEAACGGFAERALRVTWSAVLELRKLRPARSPVPAASFADGALRRWRARQLAGWAGRALPEGARGGLVVLRAADFAERGGSEPEAASAAPPARSVSSPGRLLPWPRRGFYFRFRSSSRRPSRRRDGDGCQLWPPDRRGNGNFGPRLRGASSARRRASALPSPASFLPSCRAQSVGARSLRAKRPRRPALNFGGEGSPPPTPSPALLSLSSLTFWSPGLGHPMADSQEHIVEQGAGDSASNDTVDAKPDRSSFVPSLFRASPGMGEPGSGGLLPRWQLPRSEGLSPSEVICR
ncbi:hypothetical protein J1605_022065 [Eschrichtius robustus]|uniref:Uncharacterized protein n=1 Tax=Eschrichtius robustus TaxID=9764 RepID=A0AB34HE65_ESCRO|nr:hypothetical protein J1605_022065 [Eschrichtius robustus]